MRVKLVISYDGSCFYGSQFQKDKQTVLGELQKVFDNIKIKSKIIASGRTDKGVHASHQVCHIDLPAFWTDIKKLKYVLNKMLPDSIHVKKITKVDEKFHARYSAKKRVYRYIISTKEKNPFESKYVSFINEVEFDSLSKNIKIFEGEFDFSYFIKLGSQTKTNIRTIYKTLAYKHKDYIVLYFMANGFLRTQIRYMVSALLNLEDYKIKEMLTLKKRYKIKPAPPNGLYLAKIVY